VVAGRPQVAAAQLAIIALLRHLWAASAGCISVCYMFLWHCTSAREGFDGLSSRTLGAGSGAVLAKPSLSLECTLREALAVGPDPHVLGLANCTGCRTCGTRVADLVGGWMDGWVGVG
jgi:hypothetical protein